MSRAHNIGDIWKEEACEKYLAGWITESELLEEAGEHGSSKANAHFTIAMMHLAEGKREEARNHFKMCVATNNLTSFDYELAGAYLACMDADPTWPAWISAAKVE